MNNNYALIWYSFFACLVISVVVSIAVKKD